MNTSAFEILGPIMVGPSSSHTAGAVRIARITRKIVSGRIRAVTFVLYNSFSQTYRGHGTDRALVAGMLGLDVDDTRIPISFELADRAGLDYTFVEAGDNFDLHPNTVDIQMVLDDGTTFSTRGVSHGGGRISIAQVNNVPLEISGRYSTIFISHFDRPDFLALFIKVVVSNDSAHVVSTRTFCESCDGRTDTILEVDGKISKKTLAGLQKLDDVSFVTYVPAFQKGVQTGTQGFAYDFANAEELLMRCDQHACSIGHLTREREIACYAERFSVEKTMEHTIAVMREEVMSTIQNPQTSLGGFLHGQARAVHKRASAYGSDSDTLPLLRAIAYAMAVLERSAVMGVIVAAPTAGSAGVVPGALIASSDALGKGDEELAEALWCAAAIGGIVAHNGSVSGAEGGCQAEVGTASAMAAAGLCALVGASPAICLDAAAIALSNVLGLVCDPARGLVEYPCQNRNALGVANAYAAAELALAGVASHVPFDEVVDAMVGVGCALPPSLRETARGGLALCPSICKAKKELSLKENVKKP